jgi:hypothetical protein
MKKVLFAGLFLAISLTATAQYQQIVFFDMDQSDQADFESKMENYWKGVSEYRVANNEDVINTLMLKRVGVADDNQGKYCMILNVEDAEHFDGNSWAESVDAALKIPIEHASVFNGSSVTISLVTVGKFEAWWSNGESNYYVVNSARPKNLEAFITENKESFGPYFEKASKKGKDNRSSWGIVSSVLPANQDHYTCYTYDGFATYSDALEMLSYRGNADASKDLMEIWNGSTMAENMPNGFQKTIVWKKMWEARK